MREPLDPVPRPSRLHRDAADDPQLAGRMERRQRGDPRRDQAPTHFGGADHRDRAQLGQRQDHGRVVECGGRVDEFVCGLGQNGIGLGKRAVPASHDGRAGRWHRTATEPHRGEVAVARPALPNAFCRSSDQRDQLLGTGVEPLEPASLDLRRPLRLASALREMIRIPGPHLVEATSFAAVLQEPAAQSGRDHGDDHHTDHDDVDEGTDDEGESHHRQGADERQHRHHHVPAVALACRRRRVHDDGRILELYGPAPSRPVHRDPLPPLIQPAGAASVRRSARSGPAAARGLERAGSPATRARWIDGGKAVDGGDGQRGRRRQPESTESPRCSVLFGTAPSAGIVATDL